MTCAMSGACGPGPRAARAPAGASASVAGLACMLETRREDGQQGARKLLQRLPRPFRLHIVRRVEKDRRAIVAVAQQRGFRLEELRPVGAGDVVAVDPVPAPYQQISSAAF